MLTSRLKRARSRRGYSYFGGWGNCCCVTSTKICITACSTQIAVYGALVQIYTSSGGSLVASCTTDSTGCCTVSVSGTYYVTVTVSGSIAYSGTRSLSGTVTINIGTPSTLVCCGAYAIPTSLTLTDAVGSISFDYYSGGFYPSWYGGHSVSLTSCTAVDSGGVCVVAAPSQGPVRVCYQMTCVAGTTPAFSLQRSWSWVYQSISINPIWYQDTTGFINGEPCATSPPAACGNPHTDTASGSANPTSSSPFAISFTMVDAVPGNATDDPVVSGGGDTVTVSA